MNKDYIIKKEFPSNIECNDLFESVNWGKRSNDIIDKIRESTSFAISIYDKDKIISMCRVLSDGLNYIIFDFVVRSDYQEQGVGRSMMDELIKWYNQNCSMSTKLLLFSASNKEGFYQKLGFVTRPSKTLGAGMIYDPHHEK